MNPFLGKFITLEGIEGMGKSTQLAHILAYLKQKNIDVIVTREPGGTPVAESLRKILLTDSIEPIVPKTELLIFYAARLQHYEAKIKPALEKGSWVISDRFYYATFAYQGGGRELGFEMILPLHSAVLLHRLLTRRVALGFCHGPWGRRRLDDRLVKGGVSCF